VEKSDLKQVAAGYHDTRLSFDPRRQVLWQSLWKYHFSRYVRRTDCVLELGSGYGDFINSVEARRRLAIDLWPDLLKHLAPGVEGHIGNATDLAFLDDHAVNLVFASNLVEHLTKEDFGRMLDQLRYKLAIGGRLALLQPNYRYAFREYFDDYTHVSVYSDVSLCDFLRAKGFEILECYPRFLPLTIKSRMKISPLLIWSYLHSPFKPLGKQMLVVATPARNDVEGTR
jgi:SAM-dependent methyltransferase